MSALDKLMTFDPDKIEKKKIKVRRKLSKLDGLEVEFEIVELSNQVFLELQTESINFDKKSNISVNLYKPTIKKVVSAIPDLGKRELCEHFKVNNPYQLVDKIFTPGDLDFFIKKIDGLMEVKQDELFEDKEEIGNL